MKTLSPARRVVCLLLLLGSWSAPTWAKEGEPCSDPAAHAFDFWIGDWEIEQEILQADGSWLKLPARTSVQTALDGCALIENWEGQVLFFWEGMKTAEPMKGLSVRAYDSKTGQWLIHWMDTRSPSFGSPFVGGFADGRGQFFRAFETAEGKRVGRITFSEPAQNVVSWDLAISKDGRQTWNVIWKMRMTRSPGRR